MSVGSVAMPDLIFERQLQVQQGSVSEHRKEIKPAVQEV
jgi:hypothetical protein